MCVRQSRASATPAPKTESSLKLLASGRWIFAGATCRVWGRANKQIVRYTRTVSVCTYGVQILVHAFVVFFVTFVVAVVVVPVVLVVSIDASPRSSLPDCVFGCGLRADSRERALVSVDF